MSPQEREHYDHEIGCESNEFMAAYHTSQLQRKPDDKELIDTLIKSGIHVVYMTGFDTCPHTDAILPGRREWFYAACFNLEDAKDCAEYLHENNEDGEYQVCVF